MTFLLAEPCSTVHTLNMRFVFIVFLLAASPVRAGDFMVGLRTWQAEWTPGILQSVAEEMRFSSIVSVLTGRKAISMPAYMKSLGGFYSGPTASYVTEDRRWSFSLVALQGKAQPGGLTITNIQESSQSEVPGALIQTMSVRTTQGRPVRNDIDFTAGYSFAENWKVFGGFKKQDYVFALNDTITGAVDLRVTNETLADDYHTNFWGPGSIRIDNEYRGPVGGIAWGLPVSESGSLTLSAGYFTARGRSGWSRELGFTNGLAVASGGYSRVEIGQRRTTMSLTGVTYEVLYTARVTERLFLQAGVRGQRSTMNFAGSARGYDIVLNNGVPNFSISPQKGQSYTDNFYGYSVNVLFKL
jgi:hypothetical protein